MHVAVFADIEGSFGIWRMRQCHTGTAEWQYGRACLTEDVNYVVKGAFDGGATQVTVKDTHDTGFNCLVPKLDKRAAYIGGHFTKPTFFGNVSDYDLILYVAIHAASGTPDSFFPHTHLGIFSEVRINGRIVCEMDIYGAYLGEFGVPVAFVSGEEIAVKQALQALPWAKWVVVDKHKDTYVAGKESIKYLEKGRNNQREMAADAVKHASTMKPLVLSGPFKFEATFRNEKLTKKYNTWGFKRSGKTVEWQTANMIEGFNELNKLTFFPKRYFALRGVMFFFFRNYFRIKHGYFAPTPNPEGAILERYKDE
jgi:D-amino peptidase